MKWEKHTNIEPVHGSQFDVTQYRCGIYKLSRYTWHNNYHVKPYWQAYYIRPDQKNWGDYVSHKDQYDKMPTLTQCKRLCAEHAKHYEPTKAQLAAADKSWENWKR